MSLTDPPPSALQTTRSALAWSISSSAPGHRDRTLLMNAVTAASSRCHGPNRQELLVPGAASGCEVKA